MQQIQRSDNFGSTVFIPQAVVASHPQSPLSPPPSYLSAGGSGSARGFVSSDMNGFRTLQRAVYAFMGVAAFSAFVALLFFADSSFPVVVVAAVLAGSLHYALKLARQLLDAPTGPDVLRGVSEPIREGSEGFIATQYRAIARIAVFVGAGLFVVYLFRSSATRPGAQPPLVGSVTLAVITLASFALGAALSAFAGYIALWMSVRANLRVAAAASRLDYREAFYIAIKAGVVCGVIDVGMCITGLTFLFTMFRVYVGADVSVARVPHLLVGYGFGASLVALFAQLGGGIYTKAADVGADMVGKVEANIPEDDPRNPGVIADLVGDNVGDCAGRGADLFESISGEIIGAMIIGGTLGATSDVETPAAFMLFPLVLHAFDLAISSAAVHWLRVRPAKQQQQQQSLLDPQQPAGGFQSAEDPLATLERGYLMTLAQASVLIIILSRWLLYTAKAPDAWMYFAACGLLGVVTSYMFVLFTKYYTDFHYAPVQRIAAASNTGHGTNVIAGLAVGMESTALPTLTCGFTLVCSFWLGQSSGLRAGLFGTAIATMGMLSTAVYVLAMDTFGPITDNAGGICEMSNQPEDARAITDRLDAVGNVTKATTKGYSIGAAALASFLLLRAYLDVVEELTGEAMHSVDLAIPEVYVAAMCGGMLIFVFSGWAMSAVGRAAGEVVREVRRQFCEMPGIMDYSQRPDYNRCVAIVTAASLSEMVAPGLLAVTAPVAVGLTFRLVGLATGQPLLGAQAVAGMLMFATATGILVALFLNNAGGAFDNAKKYIETGAHGGKHSPAHQAAVSGDVVGDPCKDTAGPSIHVLIKLLATIALVLAPLFINTN